MPALYKIIEVALIATFVILFMTKTNTRFIFMNYCDSKKFHIIAEMLNCDFCFSFWISFIISCVYALVTNDITCLFIPIFSSPIIRFLL